MTTKVKTKTLPFLPYLKVFSEPGGKVRVYFRDPLTGNDLPFESIREFPVHLESGRYPDSFYREYATRLIDVTERRLTRLLNGTLPKGATGVLEMAIMGGMGKEELARMISRIVVKEDGS